MSDDINRLARMGVEFEFGHAGPLHHTSTLSLEEVRTLLRVGSADAYWSAHYGVSRRTWAAYEHASTGACASTRRDGRACEYPLNRWRLPQNPRDFLVGFHDCCIHHREEPRGRRNTR